jgi:hypothetical protein
MVRGNYFQKQIIKRHGTSGADSKTRIACYPAYQSNNSKYWVRERLPGFKKSDNHSGETGFENKICMESFFPIFAPN